MRGLSRTPGVGIPMQCLSNAMPIERRVFEIAPQSPEEAKDTFAVGGLAARGEEVTP